MVIMSPVLGSEESTQSHSLLEMALVGQINSVIDARRRRSDFFRSDLFADPAWDILLDLTRARLEGRQICVSSLCIAAAVPATTALRCINSLTNEGLITRNKDPADARRVFVNLTKSTAASMEDYFLTECLRQDGLTTLLGSREQVG
jgi:DNA-binding MarR family transcriptional regulator